MTIELTSGAIARMWNPTVPLDDPVWKTAPILQVVQIKELPPMPARPGLIRRRGLLSDGTHFAPVVFAAAQLRTRFEEGKLARSTVICATDIICQCGVLQETPKRMVVLLDCEVVETLDHRIGDPKDLPTAGAAAATSLSSDVAPPPALATSQPAHMIGNLSPYLDEWTIEARLTDKSEMRDWSDAKGAGKLFSCTFTDQSGDIRATAFNAATGDLFQKLHMGRTYYVSKARVSITEKAFFDSNRKYELTMDGKTQIEEVGIIGGREAGFRSQ